jgi:ACR3 family arsenite transporter
MGIFEKYLSIWVVLCMVAGIMLGALAPETMIWLSKIEYASINLPVAILVWMMIYPMMVQVDFSSLSQSKTYGKGILLTLVINWLVKPFSMAFLSWLFFKVFFAPWIPTDLANEYLAGAILLGAAPCTAMVFVWSYLTKGDARFTLVQVSINDLVLLVAYVPIVQLLLGIQDMAIPMDVLIGSVLLFVLVPLTAGWFSRRLLLPRKGEKWFFEKFLPALKPVSILALLLTLILLFAFQGRTMLAQPWHIAMIAIPLALQTYLIFFLSWFVGRKLGLPHAMCAPSAMIGASNFFELSVAVAIALFGLSSGATLATVVGVLIEVPVMLSLVYLANRWRYTSS